MGAADRTGAKGYMEIAECLCADIRDGRYAAARSFPSLTRIMRRFGVTRVTAMRSVDELKRRGVVAASPRSRIVVKRTNRTFGLILPGLAYSEFFSMIMSEISRRCQQEGYGLLFKDVYSPQSRLTEQHAKDLVRDFVQKQVDGVLFLPFEFMPTTRSVNKEIVSTLRDAGIPVVLIDYDIVLPPGRSSLDVVGINNFDAGRRVAEHLLSKGAKNIHFFHYGVGAISVANRIAGVKSAIRVGGVGCRGRNVLQVEGKGSDAGMVRAYLKRHRPDAFVCANDANAAYLKHILDCMGRRIPEDMMLAGFDDLRYATVMTPQLTTVHQPCADIASVAVRTLKERIEDPSLPPREILLSAPLVVRESTCRGGVAAGRKTKETPRCRK